MIELSLGTIAEVVGGSLTSGTDPTTLVTGSVEFDSRKVTTGGLFVAINGARVDGHDYAAKAVTDGAVGCLLSRPVMDGGNLFLALLSRQSRNTSGSAIATPQKTMPMGQWQRYYGL